ncbi:uncharacterized protein LOC124305627 [Neodiprion virginianus]|uniref:uncharacterized protein LOC124305627 n=1 Tax=Neodiprion virginianus TaxID=2961670 RepID=UPI001EE6AF92|nr:uncharacterized protein LOC124305627 [Neodiprion virginianus]
MRVILLVLVRCILAYDRRDPSWRKDIIADASQVLARLNEPAILSCNITSEHFTNFTWLKVGDDESEEIVLNPATKLWWHNETLGTMELKFTNVTPEDNGYYICTARRSNITSYDYVGLGEFPSNLSWTVEVRGPKAISIKWDIGRFYGQYWNSMLIQYRENGTDQWLGEFQFFTPERMPSAGSVVIMNELKSSTVYEIKGVLPLQRRDSEWRYAFSKWVTTFVSGRIIPEANTVIAESTGRAVLSCDVTGGGITDFMWPEVRNFSEKYSTNYRWNSKTHVTMELEFANVTLDDSGDYKCQAQCPKSLISANSRLRVENFHSYPLKVGAIGTDRIYVNWNYTNFLGDNNITYNKVTIKYKENGTNQWHQADQIFNSSVDPAGGHYVIRKLKSSTLYHIKKVVAKYKREFHRLEHTFVLSKWVTTFEKDVEYVPIVDIMNETYTNTLTIKWSQPPPELQEYIDAYLISVESGNEMEKYFYWQKYKNKDRHKADVYIPPSISYGLVVQACFDDYCPDRHASDVMTNDMVGEKHFRARRKSKSDMELSFLTMNVTRDAENTTASSNASFTCSVSVHGYEGWWTKEGERVTSFNNSDSKIDWTITVGHAEDENSRDYTCVAKMTNDSHPNGTMLVTVIPPTENVSVGAETVYTEPFESTALLCDFFGYRLSNFQWRKVSDPYEVPLGGVPDVSSLNKTHIRMMLYFANTSNSDAGYYQCQATNNRLKNIIGFVRLNVSNESNPIQLTANAIGSKLIHLRWFNIKFPGDTHLIRSLENGSLEWKDTFSVQVKDDKHYNGYVVGRLTRGTSYWFELVVISAGGRIASTYSNLLLITLAEKDIPYIPYINVTDRTANSISIKWLMPPTDLQDHIKVYRISVNYTSKNSDTVHSENTSRYDVFIVNLQPSTSYDLGVKACFSEVSTDCYSSNVKKGVFTKSMEEDSMTQIQTWLLFTGIFFLLIVLAAWNFYKKVRERRVKRERDAYFYTENPTSFNPELAISDQADLLPYEKKWEFPRKLLRLDEELGRGSFGIVWKARAKTIRRPEAISVVAVKTVRPTASLRCMKALLRELKILVYLGHHPNIVSLLGACTRNLDYGQLLVIVEFCRFGNLHDYLWRCRSKFVDELNTDSEKIHEFHADADPINVETNSTNSALRQNDTTSFVEDSCDSNDHPGTSTRVEDLATDSNSQPPEIKPSSKYPGDFTNAELDPVRTQDLVSWAWQISRGMQYLSAKKVLHGDLAARNVLLSEDNIVKICDFGLSKSLQEDDSCKDEGNDPLPVKWMAIESLKDGIFSVKSDVWSFGVVLWELFSLAKTPYPEVNPENMCKTLIDGYRMKQPKYAPKSIYRMMLQCWEANPSDRPSFVDLESSIGDLIENNVRMHYIELYTRCARAYAQITEYRNTQDPKNQDLTPPDPIEPTNVRQDETIEQPIFREQLKQFFHRR